MMASMILLSFLLTMLLYTTSTSSLFESKSRYTMVTWLTASIMTETSQSNMKYLFSTLCMSLLLMNLLGNVPGLKTMTLFYWFSFSLALTLWLGVMLSVYYTQLSSWVAHLLPFGSPMALSILLPTIEVFSHLIRPFTLMIRLSTNLSSGHIMLYMFSFFSLSSVMLTSLITPVLVLLMLLEIFVSALQAYIFSSLILMYTTETQVSS